MSEQFQLIETRVISGLGVLQLPVNLAYRTYRVWVNLIRFPSIDFPNAKFNPERSNYCNVLFMAQSYVYREEVLRYEKHVLELDANQSEAYIGSYLSCSLTSISNALAAIAVAVGLPPPVPGSPLFVEPVVSPVTELYFSCRDDVAIQVTLFGLLLDVDCAASVPSGKQPAGEPVEIPQVPPGTPVSPSAPYVLPDDDGNTVPNPLDSPPSVTCYEIVSEGATGQNTPGVPIVGNGSFTTSYLRCDPITATFETIPFGFYAGALGWIVRCNGTFVILSASEPSITDAGTNPACPPA